MGNTPLSSIPPPRDNDEEIFMLTCRLKHHAKRIANQDKFNVDVEHEHRRMGYDMTIDRARESIQPHRQHELWRLAVNQ